MRIEHHEVSSLVGYSIIRDGANPQPTRRADRTENEAGSQHFSVVQVWPIAKPDFILSLALSGLTYSLRRAVDVLFSGCGRSSVPGRRLGKW